MRYLPHHYKRLLQRLLVSGLPGCIVCLLSLIISSTAQTYLTGEKDGVIGPGTYIVSGNLHVLPGKTLTVSAGTVMHFEPFTGIVVRGKLIVDGTSDKPIVFTSVKDGAVEGATPAEFDWNGLDVSNEAAYVRLSNVTIKYASIGVNVRSSTIPVLIDNVFLFRSGYAGILRESKVVAAAENLPVHFDWRPQGFTAREDAAAGAGQAPAKEKQKVKKPRTASDGGGKKGRGPVIGVRIGSAAVCLAGAGMWVGGHLGAERCRREYHTLKDPVLIDKNKEELRRSAAIRNAGIALTAVGGVAFGISLFF